MSPKPIPFEVLLTLLAFGWVDGSLDEAESRAVLGAARQSGIQGEPYDRLVFATKNEIEFEDLPELDDHQAFVAYGLAMWVALSDGTVSPVERRALVALSHVLEIGPPERPLIDTLVGKLHTQDADLDLRVLQQAIEEELWGEDEA